MPRAALLFLPALCLPLAAQAAVLAPAAPIQVGLPEPRPLDLRAADASVLVPRDAREPAQVEAARQAWAPYVAAVQGAPSVRLALPENEKTRVPVLLAAAQALRAANPGVKLYVAFDPQSLPVLDETAWGAVDGGALTATDLREDPAKWRDILVWAQKSFPGQAWTLWLPSDPGPLASTLLGDGGRLVVPAGGPAEKLAALIPAEYTEVEGGQGDLTLRALGRRKALRWTFQDGAWAPAALPKEGREVAVEDAAAYDVGALLGRVRAFQLRSRAAARTLEARLDVDLHLQSTRGDDNELGFGFRYFEKAGEDPELLQKEVRFNGVKAKISGEVQLPVVESRASVALPVALSFGERYRYADGGAAGPGLRRLRFEPVDRDPLLYRGELKVEEATGRILEETRQRDDLPGTVRSEKEILSYGELAPGLWRPVSVHTYERWMGPRGAFEVQRSFAFSGAQADPAGFDADREAARRSGETMLQQTPEGARYLTRQADGTRKLEEKPRSGGRALAGIVLVDPGLALPVVPLGGLALFDFNAFNKGIQADALVAGVFNTGSLGVPRLPGGFDLSASTTMLLLKGDERPVEKGRLADQDAVGHSFGQLGLSLGHDLGFGFRAELRGNAQYDRYSQPQNKDYATPGFAPPPSGWTRRLDGALLWLKDGFQLGAYSGRGQRPDGSWGTAADLHLIPDGGSFRRWGGTMSYTHELTKQLWFKGEVDYDGGSGFDRFNAINVGGGFGGGGVAGIRSNALDADRVSSAHLDLTLPPSSSFRLSFGVDYAAARALDDQKTYHLSGLSLKGDLPGFWWFTAVRVDLGAGLTSDIPGVRTVNGYVALLRVF